MEFRVCQNLHFVHRLLGSHIFHQYVHSAELFRAVQNQKRGLGLWILDEYFPLRGHAIYHRSGQNQQVHERRFVSKEM